MTTPLIRILTGSDPLPSEITSETVYFGRRRFLAELAGIAAAVATPTIAAETACKSLATPPVLLSGEKPNSWEEITQYNNFYEYSTDKKAIAVLAENLRPAPWSIRIEGECEKPATYDINEIRRRFHAEERIYRLRCVEGWSMVIPWDGIPLCNLLQEAKPTSRAKFVRFISLQDPSRMYGQRGGALSWPYLEGLRIDEAMHPLTILALGLYGKPLPNQNGAPARLVVPWKYGFKSIKSIVTIRFEETPPESSWTHAAPSEYGFYANVNPEVPHPRWTQAREQRIGEIGKRKTLPFNGYADQVAALYREMDLAKFF
ncbi:MAG: protein-methionine-sulfoxide reductase catalytic subunit MsrP [Pseudomonadota bacterium]